MNYPKFLVIRFPVAGAGNFIASCLQCSIGVGHWNQELEYAKPDVNWLAYFEQVFKPFYKDWLVNEPFVKYTLGVKEIYSSYYDRGNNLTAEEFFESEKKCKPYYHRLRGEDKFIPVFWMKPFFPEYYSNATFVDVFLDEESLRWYDRAHYHKHYHLERENEKIKAYNTRHTPSTIPKSFTGENQYITHYDNFVGFARAEIYGNPHRTLFQDTNLFDQHSGNRPRHSMTLSDVLDPTKFLSHYRKICEMIGVQAIPESDLLILHKHWINCHDF